MCEDPSSADFSYDDSYGPESGSEPSGANFSPSVEDACGAGVSVADLNSTEYLDLFSDTIGLINILLNNNETGPPFAAVIPTEDIERECEVRDEARHETVVHCMMDLVVRERSRVKVDMTN